MGSRGRIAPTCPHYPRYQQAFRAISRFRESGFSDSLTTVRRKRRRGKPEQSEELTRSGRMMDAFGQSQETGTGMPRKIGLRKAPRKRWPKRTSQKEARKRDPKAPSGRDAKADRKRWRRRSESRAEGRGGSKRASDCDTPGIGRNLYPARPCCCPRQSQGGPPRTGGGSSFGSGNHGPGDRRKARMPLPARVAHAAETRRDGPSGPKSRSPVTRGLAAMPAPFCCARDSRCGGVGRAQVLAFATSAIFFHIRSP